MRAFSPDARDLPTDLRLPSLRPDLEFLRSALRGRGDPADRPDPALLRNPHHETPVDEAQRAAATPAGVLIPILHGPASSGSAGPELLLTRRHARISFGGHICFPGGRCDPADESAHHTALRESFEEVALPPERVETIGRLGRYVTQSGFRIDAFVGLVERPVALRPSDGEVEELLTIPLDTALCERSYRLVQTPRTAPRAHYVLTHGELIVAGPTASLLIALYEHLARFAAR